MNISEKQIQTNANLRAIILLSALLLLGYSNTFNASWHLDDFSNITENPHIHIQDLHPDTIYNAAFHPGGLSRPVAYLSFALNWYFGQNNVTGYHIVNISIHIFTAFFLFLAILALLQTPKMSKNYRGNEYFIALLAAVLWATNPIQTQTVTYIIQRMASMAAMFYVLGIYLYVKARTDSSRRKKGLLYSGVLLGFLLAVGSKENALMFPASLFLIEMLFFQDIADPRTRKRFIVGGISISAVLFVLGILLFVKQDFLSTLKNGYANRTFTMTERLLTEPRIILFYLSQIFYPIADRLSIVHDFEISTDIFHPWTTLPAIIFIVCLVGAALWQMNKRPLFSLAVLFFFLNHVIESSVIPLELVFEHRNYLPSLLLFVPVAAGTKRMIDYYANKKKAMANFINGFVVILIVALGLGTYTRNIVWADERTLWQDALEKAPGSALPYINLAADVYTRQGNYDLGLALCRTAKDLFDNTQNKAEVLALENIANIYAKQRDYAEVARLYSQVISINSARLESHYHLALALIVNGQIDEALINLKDLLFKNPEDIRYLNTVGLILLKTNEPENAIQYLKRTLVKVPGNENAIISMGLAKSMLGKHTSAEHYLSRISFGSPNIKIALLLQIENSLRAGDVGRAEKYAERLISKSSPASIRKTIEEANKPGMLWPVSVDHVAPVIARVLREQSEMFSSIELAHGSK